VHPKIKNENVNNISFIFSRMSNYTSLIIGNMISKISLTPSKKQLEELYKKSIEAQQQSLEYKDDLSPKNLISKNPNCKDSGFSTTIFSRESLAFSKQGDFMIFLDQILLSLDFLWVLIVFL